MAGMHPFEKAGHGKAPFKCVGYSESWFGGGASGIPKKPGSCCDYCMTGIAHVFWILSADGQRFKVGSECVRKTPDQALKKEIVSVKKEYVSRQKKEEREALRAKKDAERQIRISEQVKEAAPVLAQLDEMSKGQHEYRARTSADMAQKIRDGMPVSGRMREFIASLYAEHQTVKSHVGKPGEKYEAELVLFRLVYVGSFRIEGSWHSREVYRWHFKDTAGNELVWKTSSGPWSVTEKHFWTNEGQIQAGDRYVFAPLKVRLRGKIKTHSEYKGEKQTEIERCKISLVDSAPELAHQEAS